MLKFCCFCFLIYSIKGFSQNTYQISVKEESQKYSKKGNKAFRKGDFKEADSLFSISLSISPNSDIYKSRAYTRKELKQYNGFCDDLILAFKYGDIESDAVFSNQCIVGNTFFVDSLMKKSISSNSYYSLNFIKYKFKNQQEYFKRNKHDELVEGYRVVDNDTLFYYILPNLPENYSPDMKTLIEYISKNVQYPEAESIAGISGTVITEVVIDEIGKIIKTEILYTPSRGLEIEVKRVFKNAPSIHPLRYKGRFVKSIMQFPIPFK